MKSLLLFTAIIFSLSANAQVTSLGDFYLEDQSISYKKIYESADTADIKERLLKQLRSTKGVDNIQDMGDYISADVTGMAIDYKKYGGKIMSVAIFLRYDISALLTIQFKDNRYRVLLENISHVDNENTYNSGSLAQGRNVTATEDYFLKKGNEEFKTSKILIEALGYMNKHFTDTFTLKKLIASEEW